MATNPQEFDFDIGDVTGKRGDTGNGISGIELLSTSGLQKTYRINMTNETHFDFVVTDGNGITGASFDAETNELTITFDNGTSFTTPSLKGAPGNPGDDGYSPAVTIETITGGHRVTITDKTHPTGQSFDVMDGASDAGNVSYDETATYQSGTVGAELQHQSRQISDVEENQIPELKNAISQNEARIDVLENDDFGDFFDDFGDFFVDILPLLSIHVKWTKNSQDQLVVTTDNSVEDRVGNLAVFTPQKNYYCKITSDYLAVVIELGGTTYPADIVAPYAFSNTIKMYAGHNYFIGIKTADGSGITRRFLYDAVSNMAVAELYSTFYNETDNYNDVFVNENAGRIRNQAWTVAGSGGRISFSSNTKRLCITEPATVPYDLHLQAEDGFKLSVIQMKAATTLKTDMLNTSGWVDFIDIEKNTPFFLQVKRTVDATTNTNVFTSAFTSCKAEKPLDKTIDLILFSGQSNMAGRGVTNSQWTEAAPVIIPGAGYEFRAISNPNYLVPIAEPFGVNENNSSGINDGSLKTGSMVTAFANAYYENNGGVPIVGVSASEGGTGISEWQPNGALLTDAIARLNSAKTWLTSNGYIIRHVFLAWCQGEHEVSTSGTQDDETYPTDFMTMFDALKAQGVEKCLLIRVGEAGSVTYDASVVIQKQTEMAQTEPDVIMVTTDLASFKDRGLMKDDWHFYQAAYNEAGRYAGINAAIYVTTGKEPTMYDPKYTNLYYSHLN